MSFSTFTRSFSSKVLRVNLTGKRANKNYYKGKRCIPLGRFVNRGKYFYYKLGLRRDINAILDFTIPKLEGFELKPYVAANTPLEGPGTRRKPIHDEVTEAKKQDDMRRREQRWMLKRLRKTQRRFLYRKY